VRALVGTFAEAARALARNAGLVPLVLATNLALALVVAVPLALELEASLATRGASVGMMYGFDYDWWSLFREQACGPVAAFAPDLLGHGFAMRNLDALVSGQLPGAVFAVGKATHPLLLGLGLVYVLVQLFLTGGLLGVFRAPAGGWSFRALAHGGGFYFARMVRVWLVSLALAGIVFAVYGPLARWSDRAAAEAVSERSALAIVLGRQALLVLALVAVHAVSSYAKVIVVFEERRSALVAWLSALGFCARHALGVAAQYAGVLALLAFLLLGFTLVDGALAVNGWRSQLVALVLFQLFVAGRIALRLLLVAWQARLHQAHGR
jgi:hypothetical protein